jgi:uncharacterized membrane protein YqjE
MPETKGLLASVKSLLGTLLATAQTRLELLANELEEDRLYLIKLVIYSVVMLFFFSLGIVLLTILMVTLYWNESPFLALGLLTAIYLGISACLAMYVIHLAKHKPRLFLVAITEVIKDRAALAAIE